MKSINKLLTALTWDDLKQWAGSKILNRGKAYVKNVSELAQTENGELVAWVSGSEDYATCVEIDKEGELDCFCTCPYDRGPCKHAVAVVLAGIERIKSGQEIPPVDPEGDLYLAIWDDSGEDDEDEFAEDDFEEEEDETEEKATPTKGAKDSALTRILQRKSKEELLALLLDFAARHPEVKRKIMEDEQLAGGKIDKLVLALRKEIRSLASEDAWYNTWKGEGNLPDYSHVREQLAALLKQGHADAVVELGQELWERGNAQVEESNDDGETAREIQECMEIVFKAVSSSSLSPVRQLLWLIDIFLEDQFSISDPGARFIRSREYTNVHWSEVAEKLRERLQAMPMPEDDSYSSRYQRQQVMDWLIEALERSDQNEKVVPLLEKEAHATQCYERLAARFLQGGQTEKAREWCIKGFQQTMKEAPGIASDLQKKLRELAEQEKRFDLVAAYRAQDFFDHPSRAAYIELQKAAEKIKVWPEIRAVVLRYLENGQRPDLPAKGAGKQLWPLPAPEVMQEIGRSFHRQYPDVDTLIDVAILEKRFDDVVELYQVQQKKNRWGGGKGQQVAEAVAEIHPDIALGIWKQIAEGQIRLVKPSAYEAAATFLRKMLKVYKETGRLQEWQGLIAAIRSEHKAKRRLMEVLDALEDKRIID